MFCDDRVFWHQHQARPELEVFSLVWAGDGGSNEVMLDDGRIVRRKNKTAAEIWDESGCAERIKALQQQESPLWKALQK